MKKFTSILLCLLLMVTFSLTGCAGFSINPFRYYNEVVATVGDTKITRFELVNAYNNYGNTYFVTQDGQTEKEAMNSTLDLLIEQEALYQYAYSHKDIYKPNAYQVNDVVAAIYDSLDDQVEDYITEAKKILNIEIVKDDEDDASDETAYPITDYYYTYNGTAGKAEKRRIDYVKTYYTTAQKDVVSDTETDFYDYKLQYTYKQPTTMQDALNEGKEIALGIENEAYLNDYEKSGMLELIKTTYLNKLKAQLETSEDNNATAIYNLVLNLLSDDLMGYEYYLRDANNRPYNKNQSDLIYRYFERTFKAQIKSQYLTNLRTNFLKGQTFSEKDLLDEYKYLVRVSHNKYVNNLKKYQSDIKDIGTKGDSILYHPAVDNVKYGYFIHTLLSFSDEQKDDIKALGDVEKKHAEYNNIIAQTEVTVRDPQTGKILKSNVENDEGELEDKTASLSTVLNEYQQIYNMPHATAEQIKSRQEAFVNFMFKYTGDNSSTLVAGMPYVVGYNVGLDFETAEDDEITEYSSMVVEFTKEAANLMQQGLKNKTTGVMSEVDTADYTKLCITEYGIHLIYYVGEVNIFDVDFANIDQVYISPEDNNTTLNLYNKILNPLTNEKYFDMLIDELYPATSATETYTSKNGYSDYEDNLLTEIYKTNTVTRYRTKIDATKPSL